MRCNRCGNPLDPRDTRCAVCGKTLVPLPPKKRPSSQRSGEQQNIKLPQLDKFTHAYSRDAARNHSFHTITLLAAVVVLVMLVMVYMKVGDLRTDVADLQQLTDSKLTALQQQQQTPVQIPTEAPTEAPTEVPTEAPARPLGEQKLTAALTMHRHGDGIYTASSMDLDGFQDEAMCWVVTAKHKIHAQWTLSKAGDRLEMVIADDFDDATSELKLKVNWSVSGETFAALSDASCVWECRASGSEWGAIPAEYVTLEGGNCQITLTQESLDLLLAQHEEMELRCQVVLDHPDGGIVTMTADGMTVARSGLVTFANKPG